MTDDPGPFPGDKTQLDLLSAVARMRQLRDETTVAGGHFLAHRLLTCDLPRLEALLEPGVVAWMRAAEETWRRDFPDPVTREVGVKQVIVMRRLKVRRGKEIAQGAHASVAWLTQRVTDSGGKPVPLSESERLWVTSSFRKITLCVDTEEEIRDLAARALACGVEAHVITDSGLTEFGGVPTVTAMGVGPDYDFRIDPITGHLPLY